MRAWAILAALALQLSFSPAAAQGTLDAEAHILSAFTSRADPQVLADDVKIGPALREQLGLPKEAVLAIGDGANDAPMIEEAGLGVAYRGKPKLKEAADALIEHNDLTALLWGQGIPRREWAGA